MPKRLAQNVGPNAMVTLPPGAQGALHWMFTGTLAPGAKTTVTYQVVVAQ